MARNPNNNPLSTVERIKRGGVATLAALGILSLGACADEVKAEKPPVTATASPTPGETPTPDTTSTPTESAPETTEAPETTSPDAPETSEPTSSEVLNGIDTSNLGPEAKERAEKLTPEYISSLSTPEAFEEAFAITLDDVNPGENGRTAAENYAELSFVNVASMLRAGCTPEERALFVNSGFPTYREFNQAGILVPALVATFGEQGTINTPLQHYSFAKRCDQLTFWLDNMRDLAEGDELDAAYGQLKDDPDVANMPDYTLALTYDPSSLEVITDGSGQYGDALSVKYNIGFKETMPYTDKQLEVISQYAGVTPGTFGVLEGSIMMQIEGVVDDSDGNKLTTNTAYAEMTSNQLEDGTISK